MACDTSTGPVDTYVPEFNIFPRRSLRSADVVQSQVDTVKCTRISKEKQKSPNNSSTVPCVLGLFCIHCNSERFDSNQLSYSTITKLPPPPQSSVYRSMLRLRNNCKWFGVQWLGAGNALIIDHLWHYGTARYATVLYLYFYLLAIWNLHTMTEPFPWKNFHTKSEKIRKATKRG